MSRSRFRTREKRGLSTVLGTIMSVGILFTTVIPLFLYVNDVNNSYNASLQTMKEVDRQRYQERLVVYAYPVDNNTRLNVEINNISPYYVQIKRLWIMDITHDEWYILSNLTALQDDIDPGTQRLVTGLDLSFAYGEKTTICIYATTSRGNVFISETNPITINEGEWSSGLYSFTLQLVFEVKPGWTERTVHAEYVGPDPDISWSYAENFTLHAKAHSNVFAAVGVPVPGLYELTINNTRSGELVFKREVRVTYDTPSPWIYIPM